MDSVSERTRDMCSKYVAIFPSLNHCCSSCFYCTQRIGQSTREGGPASIDLEHFMEALHDPSTDLTYPALTGARKQSVSDVERLFSGKMESFMERKGYSADAKYIWVIKNWRRACDERGPSDADRKQFNADFLEYILDDMIP